MSLTLDLARFNFRQSSQGSIQVTLARVSSTRVKLRVPFSSTPALGLTLALGLTQGARVNPKAKVNPNSRVNPSSRVNSRAMVSLTLQLTDANVRGSLNLTLALTVEFRLV